MSLLADRRWRAARVLAALTALATLSGCASATRHAVTAESDSDRPAPAPDRLVLATFGSTSPDYWQGPVHELAERLALRVLYAWPMASLGEECVVFEIPENRSAGEIASLVGGDPRVTLAARVHVFRTLEGQWNDAYAPLQHGLDELGLAPAHERASGRGVRVALIDTGVDLAHPDLEGRIAVARNFVQRGAETFTSDPHGTAVAGIVAADANNRIGIVGVAPRAELLALRACWPDPPGSRQSSCDTYTLASALDFALVSGARVLNLSLAGPEDALIARLLARAEELGVLVVAAVDEDGVSPFPASVPTVIGVRVSAIGRAAGAEPAGTPPATGTLTAPGTDVLTTGPSGTYDFFSGSSMAAAHVSGVAALLLERDPKLGPARLRELLGARRLDAASPRLSACGALASLLGEDVCAPAGAR